ncbi:MFS transporter [Amnibacterium sp.]|uniref:MFS transporter n=1 Tax=Amnibacterium sp. TaxID=1872496 RepID=UPI002613D9C6|nr:MFS transporter [Amnibacterium sp.]MCU1472017.1 maltose permease [Amnibacterium sp.]
MSAAGERVTARSDRLRLNALFAALGVGTGSFLPYAVVYFTWRGLSPTEAGLVVALMAGVGLLALPLWGLVADHALGTVTALRLSCVLAAAAGLALLVSGRFAPGIVVCAAVLAAASAPGEAFGNTLAIGTLRAEASRNYGNVRLWSSIGFAGAVAVSAVVLKHTNLALILIAYPAAMAVQLASTGGRRWPVAPAGPRLRLSDLRLTRSSRLLVLHGGALAFGVAMGASSTAGPLRLVSVGGGVTAVGAAAVLGALVEIPVMRMSGVLWHRLGAGKVFLLGGVAFAAPLACFAVFSNPVLLVGVSVLTGTGYALMYVGLVTAASSELPAGRQATGQALLQATMMGLGPLIGSSLGGFAYEHASPAVLFGAVAVVALAGAAVARVAAAHLPAHR